VRARRIDLRLDLKSAATEIGVARDTLRNWEKGRTEPEVRFLPALIEFLGYDPLPVPNTTGQAIPRARLSFGLSLKGVADRARVDEASVRRLEADTKGMARRVRQAVRAVLGLGVD
jgi:transcriptional regulator with XRE-family HTH domain